MDTLQTRFFIALWIIIVLFASCYTTFNHPPIYTYDDSTGVYTAETVTFMDDCASCHEQDLAVSVPDNHLYSDPIYYDDYSWQYYYAIPWWVDDYYYMEKAPENIENQLPATQRRDHDRRETPSSPAAAAPGGTPPTSSLAKPSTEDHAPVVDPPKPPERHERRQVVTPDNTRIERQAPPPETPPAEKKEMKKEEK